MNEFEEYMKASAEKREVPNSVKDRIETALSNLPDGKLKITKITLFTKIMTAAACFVFTFLFLLPNVSPAYAQVMEDIPVISDIIEVVTIRNYFYSDENHELDISVPEIENGQNAATDYINKSVGELTQILADRFYDDLETLGNQAHTSLYVNYDVVTNTESWFTLKITVFEAAGSSNTYYKYYHIDKLTGKIVKLGDIAADEEFYSIIENEIKRQMKVRMEENDDLIYWVEDSPFGSNIVDVGADHNFYFDGDGNVVIVFDKYEVSPGFMGTPEFTVEKELLAEHLSVEFS